MESKAVIEEGKRVLRVEAEALAAIAEGLGEEFSIAVEKMSESLRVGGKLVLSGVGKSGNIAQKIAATLTSTGSMAVFLHPTEALHGDLGLLSEKDCLLLFSQSGSSQELMQLAPFAKEICKSVVGIFGNKNGSLAKISDVVISSAVSREACPDNLAPTTSSTVAMALGDAIAISLKKEFGFGPEKFAKFHPAGALGKKLSTKVEDLMHAKGEFGLLSPEASIEEVVVALTKFRHSGICISIEQTRAGTPKLHGVIVEGDIRRALLKKEAFFALQAKDIMTKNPLSVEVGQLASEALEIMENRERQLSFLPVVDADGGIRGVLRVHDIVLLGIN
ncbi:MAG: KpsF/GutQ family sugar-phosphate isomerase [Oligoflexia bacterium]|nr:KpsF/GutQ family sugar-phosphate isomerase [Oligoflexia bacterium]